MNRRIFTTIGPQQLYNLVRGGLAIALLLAVLGIVPQRPVYAANIVVGTLADEDNTDGDCSLREAIYAANHDVIRDA
jgi:CSLREA domain-containing protein